MLYALNQAIYSNMYLLLKILKLARSTI